MNDVVERNDFLRNLKVRDAGYWSKGGSISEKLASVGHRDVEELAYYGLPICVCFTKVSTPLFKLWRNLTSADSGCTPTADQCASPATASLQLGC